MPEFVKIRSLSAAMIALLPVVIATASGQELPIADRPPLELSVQLEGKAAVGRAVAFLRERQRADGSWHQSPMLTSLALAALAQTPEADSEEADLAIRQALSYLQADEPPKGEPESKSEPGEIEVVEDDQDVDAATQGATNGLSRQAEIVLRIMTAISGDQHSRLSELANRALPVGHSPAALEAAVVTAVRLRECLAPATQSRTDLQAALQWAGAYYSAPIRKGLDKRECRTFIYVLGQALRAVRSELPDSTRNGDNWRRRTAVQLLNLQGGGGQWTCGNRKDGEAPAPPHETTASTVFALLLFAQVLNP